MGSTLHRCALAATLLAACEDGPVAERRATDGCDPAAQAAISFPTSPGGTPEASPALVHEHLCRLRVIDVREAEELRGKLGVLRGAEHVPQRRVAIEALGWDRNEPIVLVCRSGRRSGAVARELQEMGFTHAASMTGGMLAWNERGLPTIPGATLPEATAPPPAIMREVSREDIVAHIADRDRVRWTKAATLVLHGTQACVDGRDAHAIIGTPGGDAGELVLALATAERLSGRRFTRAEVEQIFDAYVEAFGHFYLHTDRHALAALLDHLPPKVPVGELPPAGDPDAAVRFVQAPPPALREEILAGLSEPEHVGCGHLRLMLVHPTQYGARQELVADVLRTFYLRLWDGNPALEWVVLEGRHEESAVLTVQLAGEVHAYTRIPLVSPRLVDTEIFVAHPQVSSFMREQNAAFLLEQVPVLASSGLDEPAFLHGLERLAARQLEATLDHLAPTLPRYLARFTGGDAGDAFEVLGPRAPTAAVRK